jgi:hypothetical protein
MTKIALTTALAAAVLMPAPRQRSGRGPEPQDLTARDGSLPVTLNYSFNAR